MVSHYLKKAGATVTSCDSAASGLEAYQAYKPDLIISDIGMPEKDGYHFLRDLRSRESSLKRFTPAIALTAYARDEDKKLALAAGYQKHLAKPVAWAQLLDAVKDLRPGHEPTV
jgi:CheY-like chemotaxis protein